MTQLIRISALVLTASFLLAPGCKDKDLERCEKMADKSFELAAAMGKALYKLLPADQVKEAEKEMAESIAKERPGMIKSCMKAVKENPEVVEVIDCMLSAPDMAAAANCDPDGKMRAPKKED